MPKTYRTDADREPLDPATQAIDDEFTWAWKSHDDGKYEEALARCERIEAMPGFGRDERDRFLLWRFRGSILRQLCRYEEALREYKAALTMPYRGAEISAEVAECLLKLGRDLEALNYFARAVAMGSRDPVVHYNRACLAARAGQHELMLTALAEAIALDEQNRMDAVTDPDFASVLTRTAVRELLRLPSASRED